MKLFLVAIFSMFLINVSLADTTLTIEQRVSTLEQTTQQIKLSLVNCHIENRYYGRFYRYCPVGSYVQEITINNGGQFNNILVTCYVPVVVCN